jgi:hypothetical protein
MDIKETESENPDLILLAQDRFQQGALVNTGMKLWLS